MSLFGAVADHYVAAGGGSALDSTVLGFSPLVYLGFGDASGSGVADLSPNGRAATLTGTYSRGAASLTADGAPSTDFTTARASIAHASWMDVSSFTIWAAVNADTVTGDHEIALHDDDSSPFSELAWRIRISNGKLVTFINVGGSLKLVTGATTLSTGTTYDVGATYNGTTLIPYLNGASDGSLAAGGPINTSTAAFNIGTLGTLSAEPFDGRMAKVAFFGSALSATNMAALHAAR